MPFLLIYFFTYLIFTPKVLDLHAVLGGGAGGFIFILPQIYSNMHFYLYCRHTLPKICPGIELLTS